MAETFIELGIRPALARRLQQIGVAVPTPVQERTIPLIMAGKDVIGQAQTGTGKTLAFVLPILEKVDPLREEVQALILTPTRELAIQITDEIRKLAPAVGATVLAAYGGQDVEGQIRKLKTAPHVIVATPGRLLDHLGRGTVQLSTLSILVLDEADQMLHMGFLPEVEGIIRQMPGMRQTLLFSATMPDNVRKLASRYMHQPEDIVVRGRKITLDSIKQLAIETTDRGKQQALMQLITQHRPYLAVVFCRTKIRAKKLNEVLIQNGFNSDELHGDLSQAKREQVMKRFRDAKLQVLVATDVAARGLDIEGVTHVINYDIPLDGESYIHRTGRTGRASQTGMAITFVTARDREKLAAIERDIQMTLEKRRMDGGGITAGSGRTAARGGGRPARAERSGTGRAPGRREERRSGGAVGGGSGDRRTRAPRGEEAGQRRPGVARSGAGGGEEAGQRRPGAARSGAGGEQRTSSARSGASGDRRSGGNASAGQKGPRSGSFRGGAGSRPAGSRPAGSGKSGRPGGRSGGRNGSGGRRNR